jgi:hypothetical protein
MSARYVGASHRGSWWLLLLLSWFAADRTRAEGPLPAAAPTLGAAQAEAPKLPDSAAESGDVERARVLFKQGVELARVRDFVSAAARFREALALRSAPAVQYNLAAALSQLGKHVEAYNLCQQIIRNTEAPADVQAPSRELMEDIAPQTARLTVLASVGDGTPDIAVDGEPLPADELGIARALSPGVHRVTAERNHERFFEREVSIPLGTAALVNVSLIVTESVVVQKQLVEVARSEPRKDNGADDSATRKRRRRIWSAVAASVVAVGAGVAVALVLSKPEPSTEAPVAGSLSPGVLTWK